MSKYDEIKNKNKNYACSTSRKKWLNIWVQRIKDILQLMGDRDGQGQRQGGLKFFSSE